MLRCGAYGTPRRVWGGCALVAFLGMLSAAPAALSQEIIVEPEGAVAAGESTVEAASEGEDPTAVVGSETEAEAAVIPARNPEEQPLRGRARAAAQSGGWAYTSQGGRNGFTAAGVYTGAHATSFNKGRLLRAEAAADAGAGAVGVTVDGAAALAGTQSSAAAVATAGRNPGAVAVAGTDVFAQAVGGRNLVTIADAGLNDIVQSLHTPRASVTIAYTEAGAYTIAIATRRDATAFAATDGMAFASTPAGADGLPSLNSITPSQILAFAKTAAAAYATANATSATAAAGAWASAAAATPSGHSYASSESYAAATVEIRLVQGASPASPDDQIAACVEKDWRWWKKLSEAQREKWRRVICHVRVKRLPDHAANSN